MSVALVSFRAVVSLANDCLANECRFQDAFLGFHEALDLFREPTGAKSGSDAWYTFCGIIANKITVEP